MSEEDKIIVKKFFRNEKNKFVWNTKTYYSLTEFAKLIDYNPTRIYKVYSKNEDLFWNYAVCVKFDSDGHVLKTDVKRFHGSKVYLRSFSFPQLVSNLEWRLRDERKVHIKYIAKIIAEMYPPESENMDAVDMWQKGMPIEFEPMHETVETLPIYNVQYITFMGENVPYVLHNDKKYYPVDAIGNLMGYNSVHVLDLYENNIDLVSKYVQYLACNYEEELTPVKMPCVDDVGFLILVSRVNIDKLPENKKKSVIKSIEYMAESADIRLNKPVAQKAELQTIESTRYNSNVVEQFSPSIISSKSAFELYLTDENVRIEHEGRIYYSLEEFGILCGYAKYDANRLFDRNPSIFVNQACFKRGDTIVNHTTEEHKRPHGSKIYLTFEGLYSIASRLDMSKYTEERKKLVKSFINYMCERIGLPNRFNCEAIPIIESNVSYDISSIELYANDEKMRIYYGNKMYFSLTGFGELCGYEERHSYQVYDRNKIYFTNQVILLTKGNVIVIPRGEGDRPFGSKIYLTEQGLYIFVSRLNLDTLDQWRQDFILSAVNYMAESAVMRTNGELIEVPEDVGKELISLDKEYVNMKIELGGKVLTIKYPIDTEITFAVN